MTGTDDWSSVPSRGSGHVDDVPDGLEARRDPGTPASGGVGGRVHGRPAPQYGEYAPEGWVNPVLVEQERREQDDRSRALREQAAEAAVRDRRGGPAASTSGGGTPADPSARTAPVAGRFGASPLDLVLTIGLLVIGLWSVFESFAVGTVASTVRSVVEQQYTDLADPAALSSAAVVRAVVLVVAFVLVAWWSVRRLRSRRWTFWVPLVGGVVGSFLGMVPVLVVVFQDPQVQAYLQRMASGG
jgi:uncharacterized protein YqgC (DUF456 family)